MKTLHKSLAVTLTVIVLAFSALAQQPQNVTDYYMLLTDKNYSYPSEDLSRAAKIKYRKEHIEVADTKNGYLRYTDAGEGFGEVALFKKTDGSYIVAQATAGCGPACVGGVTFYTYADGQFTDVTKQVFTAPTEGQLKGAAAKNPAAEESSWATTYVILPRIGRTLKICFGEGTDENALLEYEWNGAKFVKK